jgi:7,8-dihydropterin-6-yl-methyl-4-(beta-D-ribofuranosyl)aminobenzene 5'-phosphate synthase
MKPAWVLFWVMLMFLPQVACSPVSTAPAQIPSLLIDTQAVTAAPATIFPMIVPQEIFTPTLTKSPIRAAETSAEVKETPVSIPQSLIITILYDNNAFDQRLKSAWGFSALVEYHDHILLFDTGGDGQLLMENMRTLGIDPTRIDSLVLSHAHDDHTGGVTAILDVGAEPVVYLLPSFPASFKRQIEPFAKVAEVSPGQSLSGGFFTTGEMGGMIPEQALMIQTGQGLVIITGCAHPGIVAIIKQAKAMFEEPVRLVLGGFHLSSKAETEISAILDDFRHLGVEQVAPCHCTGEFAIKMFASEYEEDFIKVGVGSVIKLEGTVQK